jgi:hypothetical protein
MFFRRGFPFMFFAPLLLISLFVGMGVLFKVWLVAFLAMFVAKMIFGWGGRHHHHSGGHGHWQHNHHNREEWHKHKRAMWEKWQADGGDFSPPWHGKSKEMSAEEAVQKA